MKRPQHQNPPIKKDDGHWANSDAEKAEVFAKHLAEVFTPLTNQTGDDDAEINDFLDAALPLSFPIKPVTHQETLRVILKETSSRKAPGYDLITGQLLKELPHKGLVFITSLFNGIIRTAQIPNQWKFA